MNYTYLNAEQSFEQNLFEKGYHFDALSGAITSGGLVNALTSPTPTYKPAINPNFGSNANNLNYIVSQPVYSQPQQQQQQQTQSKPTTQTSSSGNSGNSGAFGGYGSKNDWFHALGLGDQAPVGWNGPSGPSQEDLTNQINSIYQPQMDYLNNLANNILPQGRDESLNALQGDYNSQVGLLPGQTQELLAPVQQNQLAFNQQTSSAADAARRSYQALQQQASAGFGGSSSTGGALGELAQQEYFRNQGDINNQQAQGDLSFKGQTQQVNNFIAQKHSDLDNWLNEAKTSINNNFRSQLAAVQQQQGTTEAARQQARLDLLQNTISQNRAIELADQQFRRQLQLFAATDSSNIGGQAMNTGAMQQQFQQLMANSATPEYSTIFQAPGQLNGSQNLAGGIGNKPYDFLSSLNIGGNNYATPQGV